MKFVVSKASDYYKESLCYCLKTQQTLLVKILACNSYCLEIPFSMHYYVNLEHRLSAKSAVNYYSYVIDDMKIFSSAAKQKYIERIIYKQNSLIATIFLLLNIHQQIQYNIKLIHQMFFRIQICFTVLLLIFFMCGNHVICGTELPRISLENARKAQKKSLKQIQELSHVLVETQFIWTQSNSQKYSKLYLAVHGISRNKKQAYNELLKKYKQISEKLSKQKIIPNPQSMICSMIHSRFLKKKRKWQFTRYFVIIYGNSKGKRLHPHLTQKESEQNTVNKILSKISKFKPERITAKTTKNSIQKYVLKYLDEKVLATQAFLEAKQDLQDFIYENLDGKYQILQTQDIQFMGKLLTNQQVLEYDLEQQSTANIRNQFVQTLKNYQFAVVSQNKGQQLYEQSMKVKQQTSKALKLSNHKIKIKVLFEIADEQVDAEEYFRAKDQDQNSQQESISDFYAEEDQEQESEEDISVFQDFNDANQL